MTMRVTMTRAGSSDTYGRPLLVGQTYTVTDEYGRDLVQQSKALDTDGVLEGEGNDPFLQGALYNEPATLPESIARNLPSGIEVYATRAGVLANGEDQIEALEALEDALYTLATNGERGRAVIVLDGYFRVSRPWYVRE